MSLRPIWLSGLLVLLLSACGGDDASGPFLAPSSVEGRAAKGILQSARIAAYALENGQRCS